MNEIIATFSELFGMPVIVAGGAVRDQLLGKVPKDYDLFLLGQDEPGEFESGWENYRAEFQSLFEEKLAKFPKVKSEIEWHNSEPFLLETLMFEDKKVQIMAHPEKTMEDLIATFDWSVCCFAYDGQRFLFDPADLAEIKPGGYLRLNKITYPYSTLRRGYRFSERIHNEDLKTLCNKIISL